MIALPKTGSMPELGLWFAICDDLPAPSECMMSFEWIEFIAGMMDGSIVLF